MSFYEYMVEQSVQLIMTAKTPREKLAALRAARAAKGDMLNFLQSIGFWEQANLKFGKEQEEERMRRADKLSAEGLKVFGDDPDAPEVDDEAGAADEADAAED